MSKYLVECCRVRVRISLHLMSGSGYAHAFILLSVVIVTVPCLAFTVLPYSACLKPCARKLSELLYGYSRLLTRWLDGLLIGSYLFQSISAVY